VLFRKFIDSTDPRAATCIQVPTPLGSLQESSDIDLRMEAPPIVVKLKSQIEADAVPLSQMTASLVVVILALEV
jgi:hypothetical protein